MSEIEHCGKGIPCFVEIRRNADGVVRRYANDFWNDYIWSDGNFACDCNRALFFARAAGEPDPNQPCGDSAYALRIVTPAGEILYEDDDWGTPLVIASLKAGEGS